MPRVALYPGSFDPVTNGHLDVVRHAVDLCDRLVVAIGVHPGKAPLFSVEERLSMLREVFEPVASHAKCEFDCVTFDDLTVTAAKRADVWSDRQMQAGWEYLLRSGARLGLHVREVRDLLEGGFHQVQSALGAAEGPRPVAAGGAGGQQLGAFGGQDPQHEMR